ncbi:MAG: NAD-dependent epimerase/dehydratase family protein, partial [Helicobacter sp.]|uniref:NAD-dependent epimerase/dehydratase family protein n=1 Tax=Helicobacter sp. TaxID=218 RepID=UPI002A90E0AF
MPNKKILVTGGAGYIGSHANALLNTLGFQTIVLDNLVYGHKESLHYAPLPFSYTSPFTKSPTISSQYLDSTLTNYANKTTNSSNCSVALEALAKLEGRSYLSDNDYPSNLANRSNCIDKGTNLENLDSKNSKTPTAEVSCDDFAGCEAFFARSYLSGSAEAKKANSRKSTQE